jgi:DNA-binding GntR family transcriptional regulator
MPRAAKITETSVQSLSEPIRQASGQGTKLVRMTTVELVTAAIRERILTGRLVAGRALRQEALAEELGVSRVPIREAITHLQAEGMLNVIPHRGAYVCELSVAEIKETFDIRIRLEPWIFAEAIPRITPAEIAKAERLIAEMDEVPDAEWGHLNWRFHETLYLPSQREIAISTLKRLNDLADRYFRFQVMNVPIRKHTHEEHSALVDLCRQRDADAGAKFLERHLLDAREQIVGVVEKVLAR